MAADSGSRRAIESKTPPQKPSSPTMFEMSDSAQPFSSAGSGQRPTLGGDELGVPATLPEQRSQATMAGAAGHDELGGSAQQRQHSAGLPPIRRWVQRAEGDRRRRARLRILE